MARGSIFKRGRTWYVSLYRHGDRVRKAAGPSKVAAQRLLAELQRAEHEHRPFVALEDLFLTYLSRLRAHAKSTSAKQADVQAELLMRHFGRTFDVCGLRPSDLDGFIESRLETVRKPTVNVALGVLRSAMRHGVAEGILPRLPCRVTKLKEGKRLPRVLEPAQVRSLLAVAAPPFDAMIGLAAYAGLRHQEILHLQARDVDLNGGLVKVTAKPGWSPKSHHEREVPLSEPLRALLEPHVQAAPSPTSWLFPGNEGTARVHAHEPIRKAFQAAGLYDPEAKPGLHSLRRTWATALLGASVDIETVRQLGGWSDLVTVQRYVTSTDDRKRLAIAALEY
jgi:integrase